MQVPGRVRSDRGLIVVAVIAAALVAGTIFALTSILDGRVYTFGPSMNPTMRGVSKVDVEFEAYAHRTPRRGETVALQAPAGLDAGRCGRPKAPGAPCSRPLPGYSKERLIKRVIALPGDRVAFRPDGRLELDGEPQGERYVRACRVPCGLPRAVMIPAGHYFVAGDNRGNSTDSREWGPVPLEAIDGRVREPLG